MGQDYNLVACIPDMGVISISQDRKVSKITDETNRSLTSVIDDRRLSLADDLDIAPDGRIFFSEATIRYRLKDWLWIVWRVEGTVVLYAMTQRPIKPKPSFVT